MFYLVGETPFDVSLIGDKHPLVSPPSVIGNLAIQVGALFLVDLLGQTLSRRLTERDLLTNELLEHLHDAVLVVDRDGRILYSNARFGELLRLPNAPERGERIQHVLSSRIHVPLMDLLATDGDQLLTIRREDERVLVCHRHPLIGRRRRIVGTVLTITDETRLRRLEGQAQRSESLAEMGEMAASIAHEVRNPLASLRGCIQELVAMLEESHNDDASLLGKIMVDEADRIDSIVTDFLQMSRQKAPQPEPVFLPTMFGELERLCRRDENVADVDQVTWDVAESCPRCYADRDQLKQILLNLVRNSAEALVGQDDKTIAVIAREDSATQSN